MKKIFFSIFCLAVILALGSVVQAQVEITTENNDGTDVQPSVVITTDNGDFSVTAEVETADQSADTAIAADSSVTTEATVDEPALEGVEVVEPTAVPSAFGLWWKGIKEKVKIATTPDPVKKAELRLQYAEERMKIAEKIASVSTDPAVQERAQKVIESAQSMMEKVQTAKDKWMENKDERVQRLIKNLATHQVRKEAMLDRMEAKVPEDKLDKWNEMRVKAEEGGMGILNAMQNENLPEAVKVHLESVKEKVQAQAAVVKEFQAEKQKLLEAAKNGDETAKEQIKNLWQERQEKMNEVKANYQEKKENLPQASGQVDEQAKPQLKMMNRAVEAVKNRVENKLENTAARLETKAEKLQQAVDDGDDTAGEKLEKVENVQERVENRLEKIENKKPILPPAPTAIAQ